MEDEKVCGVRIEKDKPEKGVKEENEQVLSKITENIPEKERVVYELLADIKNTNLGLKEINMLQLVLQSFKNMIFKNEGSKEDEGESNKKKDLKSTGKSEAEVKLHLCKTNDDMSFAKAVEIENNHNVRQEMLMDEKIVSTGSKDSCMIERVTVEKSDFKKILIKDKETPLPVLEKVIPVSTPNDHSHKKIGKRKKKKVRERSWLCKMDEPQKEKVDEEFELSDYIEHDKKYFFEYSTRIECKLCSFKGKFIVQHYRTAHPESEVLISRLSPDIAEILIEDAIRNREEYDKDHPELEKMTCNFKCPFCLKLVKDSVNIYYDHISSHTGEYCFLCNHCSYWTYNHTNIHSHLNQTHYTKKTQYKMVYLNPKISKYVFGYICSECNFIQLIHTTVEEHSMVYHPGTPKIHKVNLGVFLHEDLLNVNCINTVTSGPGEKHNHNLRIPAKAKELSSLLVQMKEPEEVKVEIEPKKLNDNLRPTFICQPELDIKQDSECDRTEVTETSISDSLQIKLVTETVEETEKIQREPKTMSDEMEKFNEELNSPEQPEKAKKSMKMIGIGPISVPKEFKLSELVPPYNCKDDGILSCLFKTLYFDEYLKHMETIHQVDGPGSFSSKHKPQKEEVMEGWLAKEVGPFQCRYCKKATVTHQEMGRHQAEFHAQEQCLFYYRKFVPNDTVINPEEVNLEDPSFINHVVHLPNQVHLCNFNLMDGLPSLTSAELTNWEPEAPLPVLSPPARDTETDSDQWSVSLDEPETSSVLVNDDDETPHYSNSQCLEDQPRDCNAHNNNMCKWKDCSQTYDSQTALGGHIEEDHVGLQKCNFTCFWINCSRELKPFTTKLNLLIHMRVHSGEKPYKCTFKGCNRAFPYSASVKVHQKSHTRKKSKRIYSCQFSNCNKSFSLSVYRDRHQRSHHHTISYDCQVTDCSEKFTNPDNLQKCVENLMVEEQLEATSAEDIQKKDDVLLEKSSNSSDEAQHERTNYDTCKWKDCYQTYDSQMTLGEHIEKNHIQLQGGEKFTCLWIDCQRNSKPFATKQMLLIHMRSHTGEKPYKCTFKGCNKAFSYLSSIKIHQGSHTRKTTYSCQFSNCSKRFLTSYDRNNHQRTHYNPDDFAYQVSDCSKEYDHPRCLRKHLKKDTVNDQLKAKQKSVEKKQKQGDLVLKKSSNSLDGTKQQETHYNTLQCKWTGCYQTYDSRKTLEKHMMKKHVKLQRGEEFICLWISCARNLQPFTNRPYLARHIRVHSGEKPYKCTFEGCNKTCALLGSLKVHQKRHTKEKPYLCQFSNCFKTFSHKSERESHQKTHCDTFQCEWKGCYRTYDSQIALGNHIEKKHVQSQRGEEFACLWTNCPKKSEPLSSKNSLMIHMRVHSGDKPYICTFQGCDKSFAQSGNLKVHERMHTGIKLYLCQFSNCLKGFTTNFNRINHQKIHCDTIPYASEVTDCSEIHTDQVGPEKHVENHMVNEQSKIKSVEDKQKENDFVLEKTSNNSNGAKHQRTHYNALQCRWKRCYQTCRSQTALVKHIEMKHVRLQRGEEFTCFWNNCRRKSKPFTHKHNLSRHMSVHSGKKPYTCPSQGCNKTFSQLADLKVHQRRHTGEKPYACHFPNCFKTFFTSAIRNNHQLMHYDPEAYACQVTGCSSKYSSQRNLGIHLKKHTVDEQLEAKQNTIEKKQKQTDIMLKKFSNSSDGTKLQRTNHDTLQCEWKDCCQTYNSQTALAKHIERNHVRLQRGEKIICFWKNCPRKSKPFTMRGSLSRHMGVHSGIKTFKCPKCSKAFLELGHLKNHQKRHTGKKTHFCQFANCFQSFSTSYDRDYHQMMHKATENYQATSCTKKNADPSSDPQEHMEDHKVDDELDINQKAVENEQKENDFIIYHL